MTTSDDAFPFAEHHTCVTLTRLTAEQLPRDGSLGRVMEIRKDIDLWQAEDPGDRIYFLLRGEVAISAGGAPGPCARASPCGGPVRRWSDNQPCVRGGSCVPGGRQRGPRV